MRACGFCLSWSDFWEDTFFSLSLTGLVDGLVTYVRAVLLEEILHF